MWALRSGFIGNLPGERAIIGDCAYVTRAGISEIIHLSSGLIMQCGYSPLISKVIGNFSSVIDSINTRSVIISNICYRAAIFIGYRAKRGVIFNLSDNALVSIGDSAIERAIIRKCANICSTCIGEIIHCPTSLVIECGNSALIGEVICDCSGVIERSNSACGLII